MCKFVEAWIGQCKKEPENDFCIEHSVIICVSCGKQATHTCDETSSFVCGAPLCEDCEHTICSNGCNSGGDRPSGLKAHCKKTEQVFLPWIETKGIQYTQLTEEEIFDQAITKHTLFQNGEYTKKDILALIRYARLIGYNEGYKDCKEKTP